MTPITYTSEQDADYAKALGQCDTLPKLVKMLDEWKELATDAYHIVHTMTEDDFKEWRKGAAKEKRGVFAGEAFTEKYGALHMPSKIFKVSIMAFEYKVPWGLMYTRLKESGNLEKALA